jgi:rhodanese-related sulfurtransferase
MTKKLYLPLALLLAFSMLLTACGGAQAPVAEPVVEAPTAVPVVETEAPVIEEVAAPDVVALFDEMVNGLPTAGYGTVASDKLMEEMAEKMPFLLDVREASELEKDGYIEGTVSIPVRDILNNLDKLPGLDEQIVIYCGSGHRGAFVFAALKLLGYTDVRNLNGGLNAWKKAELPVVTGSMPEAPAAISAPIIADQALFETLNGFFVNLPESFYNIKADGLAEKLTESNPPHLIDLRTQAEIDKDGYIAGAVNIPLQELFTSLDKLPGQDEPIVVYCAGGQRSAIALEGLSFLGYTNVINLGGGIRGWKNGGFATIGGEPTLADTYGAMIAGMAGYNAVKADALLVELAEDKPPFLLDVRSVEEVQEAGHIEGATHIPLNELAQHSDLLPGFDTPIVTYCGTGWRSTIAMTALHGMGWTNVRAIKTPFADLVAAGYPIVAGLPEPMVLDVAKPAAGIVAAVDPALVALKDKGWGGKASDALNTELVEKPEMIVIDARTPEEIAENGVIALEGQEYLTIPMETFMADKALWPADKDAEIVIYCGSGHRSTMAMTILLTEGYSNVTSLKGGFGAWKEAGLPVAEYVAP